ncbi:MAG: cytochrome P460 family protein [Candidatus Acidiferrales bacterium]
MRALSCFVIGSALLLVTLCAGDSLNARRPAAPSQANSVDVGPRYDSHGALIRPRNFETWIFVGSSIGLTYEPGIRTHSPGEFHDVYLRPTSYREYARTGRFPEKTMLVLALYPPEEKVSPAKGGYFEGDLEGMAVAVKDHERFREGWAYFNFGDGSRLTDAATANPRPLCYSCHKQHAADDNVFVQFYPVLRAIADAHSHTSR